MRNRAIVLSLAGRVAEGLTLLDSAIARDRARGIETAVSYMTGQRVPMLVRLGRLDEAARSAATARSLRDQIALGSTRGADIDLWSGMVEMAQGRYADAARLFSAAHETYASRYSAGHPRPRMLECALGVALARSGKHADAREHVRNGCEGLAEWGLADPSIVAWGIAETTRLGLP
jgi:hypothetical protein